MATDKVIGATSRRNVKPISTTINANVARDVDVSGMSYAPEDGEFVVMTGERTAGTVNAVFQGAAHANVTATEAQGQGLKMIWGSALRSDRSALGEKRVPAFDDDIDIVTHCYAYENGTDIESHYPINTPLSVIKAPEALQGSADRLLLAPLVIGNEGWVVGHVIGWEGTGAVGQGKKLKIRLYRSPRYINPN
jgi:hypothetical protein